MGTLAEKMTHFLNSSKFLILTCLPNSNIAAVKQQLSMFESHKQVKCDSGTWFSLSVLSGSCVSALTHQNK